ncbi:MAG TPA: ABC transporter permease [Bryobacteraceae bacterium]
MQLVGTIVRDARHALRLLAAKPGFTATAVAVLALGIGANAAIFTLINFFLFKPLALHKPEELVGVYSRNTKRPEYRAFSYPNYADLRDRNTAFAGLMAHNMAMVGVGEGDATRRVFADIISSNAFDVLGAPLFRGRAFTAAEERPGSRIPVAIVSYSFWKKRGADPDQIGRTIRINGQFLTIVGIAAEGFTGTTAILSPELFLPMGMYEPMINDFEGHGRKLADRANHALILIGRLRPGLTAAWAEARLAPMAAHLEQAFPAENKDQAFAVRPLPRLGISTSPVNNSQLLLPASLLLAMSGVVLLIASLNVANMMLARGTARRREIAIRLALGGSRGAIVRQLFTEGMLLALAGGATGLVAASWSTSLLIKSLGGLAPVDLVYRPAPDLRVLTATLLFCVFSTVLFAVWPAWNLSRPHLATDLKEGDHDLSGGRPRRLFSRRNLLVMGQLALSLMLLTAAGLFMRSASRAAEVRPGFRMEGIALADVDPSLAGYDEARGRQVYRSLLDRLAAIPGVESVAPAATVPFGMVSLGRNVERPSDPHPAPNPVGCRFNVVGERYFETLGIPLLRGRTIQPGDNSGAPRVAILDEIAARKLWPNEDALERTIRMVVDENTVRTALVIGIVGTVKDEILGHDADAHVYVPFAQEYQSAMTLHVRMATQSREGERRILEAVGRELRAVDAGLPVFSLKTMRDHLDASAELWLVRMGARLFTIFGAVALLLASIGLYGVRAYTVARRTREIGIRMALGADRTDTLRLILREGAVVTAVGTAFGLALSLALGKGLSSFLFEVSGVDAAVFTAAPALLGAVSLVACYLPARRAAQVDPMVALRSE